MARKEQGTRSIKLPPSQVQQRPPQPQRPAQQQRGPAQAPNSDVGRALADLDANAQVRDRSQLPSKVKVITPQVIMNIVQSITDKFGMDQGIDRNEFNQLVMQQTQNEMRIQQANEKLVNYQAEYKKLYEAYQTQQGVLKQAQQGSAGAADFAKQYESQIAELQQRNAAAVDTYMDLQQQLDSMTEQYSALEAALGQRDQDVAQMEQRVQEAEQGGTAAAEAQQEIERLQEQLAQMDQQLAQMENTSAEASEGVNAVARERDELAGQVTSLQSEVEELRAQVEQAQQGAEAQVAEFKNKLKQSERSHAKVENMEIELEKLRTAEGAWLEEKRRLASQLSNETNLRRETEQKLKAFETGEALPAAAQEVEQRATQAEAQHAQARKEIAALEKQLQKAQAGAAKAEQAGSELEQARAEAQKSKDELKRLNDDLGKAGNAAKELGMLKRKFENVETELEGLRSAEGKWLEEKRRMAAQLSNESNLRRELEQKLRGEIDEAKAETSAAKKKSEDVTQIEQARDKAIKDRDVAERSLNVIEEENESLRAANDGLQRRIDALQEGGGQHAKEVEAQLAEAQTLLRDTELKLAARHEHVAKIAPQLDEANKEVERLRTRATEAEAENQATVRKFEAQAEKMAELAGVIRERDERIAELEEELKGSSAASDKLSAVEKHEQELADELADAQSEAEAATAAREASREEVRALNVKLQHALKDAGRAEELQRQLESRDHQQEVTQQQLTDLRDELKLEEEERNRISEELNKARESEAEAAERVEALERELEELKGKLEEAQSDAGNTAEAEALKDENAQLKVRNEEIARKRDEVLSGLQKAVGELDAMKEVLAERDVDLRAARAETDEAMKLAEEIRSSHAVLEEKHRAATEELARIGGSLTNSEVAAEKAREEIEALQAKISQATELRHEAEKQLVETRAKLDAEQELRRDAKSRIEQLEDDLQRAREQADKSAPAEALTNLSAQLANERTKWEMRISERENELADMRSRLKEAEGRESDLASQLESVELSKQDAVKAKALAGQRRAQIERMQSDVEGAKRQAKESEAYWKKEMTEFQDMVAAHLLSAENKEEGSDKKLQGLLEELNVGIADKYAKLRRKATRTEHELEETNARLAAVEKILAKRQEEDSRVNKIVQELEGKGRGKKTGKVTAPKKGKNTKKV